jgi:hypothetical protein
MVYMEEARVWQGLVNLWWFNGYETVPSIYGSTLWVCLYIQMVSSTRQGSFSCARPRFWTGILMVNGQIHRMGYHGYYASALHHRHDPAWLLELSINVEAELSQRYHSQERQGSRGHPQLLVLDFVLGNSGTALSTWPPVQWNSDLLEFSFSQHIHISYWLGGVFNLKKNACILGKRHLIPIPHNT